MNDIVIWIVAVGAFAGLVVGIGCLLAAADFHADLGGEAREDYVDRMRGGGL